jgi:hypothetical protein
MGVMTKWSVLREQHPGVEEYDAGGAVQVESVERWIDDACRTYVAQCDALELRRAREGLELTWRHDPMPGGALAGRPTSVFVSASATELWPNAFAISVRLRALDGTSDRPVNVVCRVELRRDGEAVELGDEIRDGLIALEHAARHYN